MLNIETDLTDDMVEQGATAYQVLDVYIRFLVKLLRQGKVAPSLIQVATTDAESFKYGDVAVVRFLAYVLPFILLADKDMAEEEFNKLILDAIEAFKGDVHVHEKYRPSIPGWTIPVPRSRTYYELSERIRSGLRFGFAKEFLDPVDYAVVNHFKETIVDKALTKELTGRGLKVDDQKRIDVYYRITPSIF